MLILVEKEKVSLCFRPVRVCAWSYWLSQLKEKYCSTRIIGIFLLSSKNLLLAKKHFFTLLCYETYGKNLHNFLPTVCFPWILSDENTMKLLDQENTTLEDAGFQDDDSILAEIRSR